MFMQIETEIIKGKRELLLINLHHVIAIYRSKDHPEMKIKRDTQAGYGSQFKSFKVMDYTYSELVAMLDTIKMPLHDKIENFEVDDRSCIKG